MDTPPSFLGKTHTVYTYAMDNDLVHIFLVVTIFIGLLAILQVFVAFSFDVVAIRNDFVAIVRALYK